MIEKIVYDFLKSQEMNVYFEESDRPESVDEYLIISKTSSGGGEFLRNSTIVIKSYAKSLYLAAMLNEHVKNLMKQIIVLDEITKCSLNSDYEYTDTAKKKYRYQAVFDIYHYC